MQPVQSKHSPAETTVWDGPRQEYPSLHPPDFPDQMKPPESWSSDRANARSSKQQTVVLMICVFLMTREQMLSPKMSELRYLERCKAYIRGG